MNEGPWVDWSVKDHVDETQRLTEMVDMENASAPIWLPMAQIHATLALTKAQLGQVTPRVTEPRIPG